MASAEITFNFGAKKRREALEKAKREQESKDLFTSLIDKGAQPDVAQQAAMNFLKTGEIKMPEYQTKILPGTMDVPSRSTREPLTLRNKKALYSFDAATGKYGQGPELPSDVDSVSVNSFNSDPKNGYDIYVDAKSGDEIRREPNGTKANRTIRIGSTSEPKGAEPADLAIAKDTVKKYQAALLKGEDISDEFRQSAEEAAAALGIPLENKQLEPTLLDKFRNKASAATKGFVDPAEKRFAENPTLQFNQSNDAEYQRDLQAARQAIAKKLVTPQEAMARLQKKHGRKIKGL